MMSVQLPAKKLSKEKGVALYMQLSRALRDMIHQQGAKPGDPLPTEEQLGAAYGVSRSTIRDALAQLEQEHLVERRQGIGTFVSRPLLKRDLQALTGFSEDMIARGLRPSSRLLDYQQPASAISPLTLRMPYAPLVRVVRQRLADGEPFGIHDTLIPQQVAERSGLLKSASGRISPFHSMLRSKVLATPYMKDASTSRPAPPIAARALCLVCVRVRPSSRWCA